MKLGAWLIWLGVTLFAPQAHAEGKPWALVHGACDAMAAGDEVKANRLLRRLTKDAACVDCAIALAATMAETDERCPWTPAQRGLRMRLARPAQQRLAAAHALTAKLLAGTEQDLVALAAPRVTMTIVHSLSDEVEVHQVSPTALAAFLRSPERPLANADAVRLLSAGRSALLFDSPWGITHGALFLTRMSFDAKRRVTGIWLMDGE